MSATPTATVIIVKVSHSRQLRRMMKKAIRLWAKFETVIPNVTTPAGIIFQTGLSLDWSRVNSHSRPNAEKI
ncbi:MAG TPA: hypothetical protein PLF42_15010 [Anaerolineales bacterium]|nr:hypothetical protein [Anaerolineales bacterium]